MEQECHSKVNIPNGIMNSSNNCNEIITNNNNSIRNGPNENESMHVIPMVSYQKEPVTIGSPLVKMLGTNDKDTSKSLRNTSCYKSKVNSNGRRIADTSLRMRPYFIPERLRTKSENSIELEAYNNAINCPCTNGSNSSNLISVDTMSSNSNSMMETCDAYLNSDCSVPSSSSYLPNPHILNSNQYFKPIKTHSLTSQIKKSRSLENIRVENIDGSQPSHEMEFVSSRIQKLKVQE